MKSSSGDRVPVRRSLPRAGVAWRAGALAAGLAAVVGCQSPGQPEHKIPQESAAIPPGQEKLLFDMLGGHDVLPGGCHLGNAGIDRTLVKASYQCDKGATALIELHHPDTEVASLRRTAQFALVSPGDRPLPAGLVDALAVRIGDRESAWLWKDLRDEAQAADPPAVAAPTPAEQQEQARVVAEACERMARTASAGKRAEPEPALSRPDEMARGLRDVYTCAAIAASSEGTCDLLEPARRGECRATLHFYEAARAAHPGVTWASLVGATLREHCMNGYDGVKVSPSVCEAMEAAISAQDPARCPAAPSDKSWCAAIASGGDASLCADADCKGTVDSFLLLKRGGLEALAREGRRGERSNAAAALGLSDACDAEVHAFVERCHD